MIQVKGKTLLKVRDTSPTLDRVDGSTVALALEAQPTEMPRLKVQGPVALFGLRQSLAARLRSRGGRPSLGVTRRQKIPLDDEDWDLLCKLSQMLADGVSHPTPGQVASELLHDQLDDMRDRMGGRPAALPCRQDRPLRDVVGASVMKHKPKPDTLPVVWVGAQEAA
jgi:hypothetical protein